MPLPPLAGNDDGAWPTAWLLLAEETTATFVPLASRLGVWSLKARLEDACFLRLNPREHAALARELERDGRRASVADAVRDVAAALDDLVARF